LDQVFSWNVFYFDILFRQEQLPAGLSSIQALRSAVVREVLVVGPDNHWVRDTKK
jgi:hypothetical protein